MEMRPHDKYGNHCILLGRNCVNWNGLHRADFSRNLCGMERAGQCVWNGSDVLHIGSVWATTGNVIMNAHSPSPGILETVVAEESLLKKDVSTHDLHDEEAPAMSKSTRAMYRRALKARKAQDAESRQICAMQRAKREGTDHPVDPVITEEATPKVQTLLSDF